MARRAHGESSSSNAMYLSLHSGMIEHLGCLPCGMLQFLSRKRFDRNIISIKLEPQVVYEVLKSLQIDSCIIFKGLKMGIFKARSYILFSPNWAMQKNVIEE